MIKLDKFSNLKRKRHKLVQPLYPSWSKQVADSAVEK